MYYIYGIPITGVAVDLEGTLVNLEEYHHRAHQIVARGVGVELDIANVAEVSQLLPNFIGGPDRVVMQQIRELAVQQGNIDCMPVEEMLSEKLRLYRAMIADIDTIPLRDGAINILEQLREWNIPIAIGSVTSQVDARDLLRKSRLDELFDRDHIVLAEDVIHLKPHPEVYLKTAERMNIAPQYQLGFEDSPVGIKALVTAGSFAIGMPVFYRQSIIDRLLESGAHFVFEDWRSVQLTEFMKEGNRGRGVEKRG